MRRIKARSAIVTFAVAVFVTSCGFLSEAMGSEFFLLDEPTSPDSGHFVEGVKQSLPANFPVSKRFRPVKITLPITTGEGLSQGDTLILNLFDDTNYAALIDRISLNVNGTVSIRGRLEAYPFGEVLISTTAGRSLVSIRIPETGEHYIIQSDPNTTTHYLLDLEEGKLRELDDAPPPIPDIDITKETQEAPALNDIILNGPLDPVNIDIMIVYTPAARDWANSSGGGINNVIAQAMAKAQLALDNSNTILTMTLVYSSEISYTESGSSSTDLSRLQSTSDGYLDNVHTWRNQYWADLVVLFTYVEDVGGIGYLLSSTSGSPAYGFSITRVQQAGWTYTTIHEMGHNMGCHHHKQQLVQPGPGIFSYSAGWRWIGNDSGKYCSVMTYEDGQYFADGQTHTRVGYFSNPDIVYQAVATGHSADGDNARTIREVKDVVSTYRTPGARLCEDCEPEDTNLGTIGTTVWGYNTSGNCGNGGKWVGQFVGEAGAKYHFDLCPSSPGNGTNSGFDPDIKITNSSCSILTGQDGSCNSPGYSYSPNNFLWTCPSNGTYYVIIAPYYSYDSHTCDGTASNTFTLNYYKEAPDTTPPSPNPMTWATVPTATGSTSITMTATTAADNTPPVQYYFECTIDGSKSSSWQTSTTYGATGLTPSTLYSFRVKARDSATVPNETGWSSTQSATTLEPQVTFVAAGTAQSGTGNITVPWPTHQTGDVALLFIESCGGQAANLSPSAGFVNVLNSPQSTGTTTNGTRLTVYWCRATSSSMSSPTVTDPGNHVYGRILTFRGVTTTDNPWDVTAGGTKATASTTTTFGAVTTTVNNTLIVLAASRDNDSAAAAWSTWTNTNLSSLTERSDGGTSSNNGGGVGVATGVKSTAGDTGQTTATVTSSVDGHMTIALKPETGVSPPGQATNPNPANGAANIGVTTDLSWTAGTGSPTSRDVYFGTASSPPLVSSSQVPTTYDTGTMSNNTTYYWRIDEKNAGGTTTGDVWSFTTNALVPNVLNITEAAATTAITGAGLVVGTVTYECSNTVAAGLVISQTPTGGTQVDVDSPVNLVVSTGKPSVPDVTGQSEAEAIAAIGLVPNISYGSSSTECSDTVAADSVISQSATGTVSCGTVVNLVVSTGPCLQTISGYVTEPDANIPVEGVSIDASNGGGSDITDANGYYEVTVVYGWSGVVTPQKEGYVFEPNSNAYINVTQNYSEANYTATLITFKISGRVFEQGLVTPIIDVNIAAENGGGSWTSKYGGGHDITDANGYYEVAVDYNWDGNVAPTKYAYGFEPNCRRYSDVNSDQNDQDYTGRLLTFAISGYIRNDCSVPIAGVLVDANNGGSQDTTDVNGFYEVWVDYNWSGTVTPNKAHYTFDPNSRAYTDVLDDVIDQNYTATNIYDLDCDGSINFGDVAVISENWLETGENIPGDIYEDENNIVNFLDFSMFAEVWEED